MKTIPIAQGVVHKVPPDIRAMLAASPSTLEAWSEITPLARNEWLCFVEDAKKSVTREKRIARIKGDLARGKKRPCCWAGCPHR